MKIYTKKGDDGTTGLYGGTRLSKADLQIESYGTVDELNSQIGLLLATIQQHEKLQLNTDLQINLYNLLINIQKRLFDIGAHLAADTSKQNLFLPTLEEDEIAKLEIQIDNWEKKLPELKNFILPGGNLPTAQAHICRTVCRRAERCCVRLAENLSIPIFIIHYLNRLSDMFFVLSRWLVYECGNEEIKW